MFPARAVIFVNLSIRGTNQEFVRKDKLRVKYG